MKHFSWFLYNNSYEVLKCRMVRLCFSLVALLTERSRSFDEPTITDSNLLQLPLLQGTTLWLTNTCAAEVMLLVIFWRSNHDLVNVSTSNPVELSLNIVWTYMNFWNKWFLLVQFSMNIYDIIPVNCCGKYT